MSEPGTTSLEIVVPGTGEMVPLDDPAAVARAHRDLTDLEMQIRDAKAMFADILAGESRKQGTKTLRFGDIEVEMRGGPSTEYAAEEIETGLREAGMPEDRIREIVKETVSYKIDARKASSAASANPDYAKVIEAGKRIIEKPMYPSVKRA